MLGAQACLAGGAQLLRRESLEAIGGEIDTSSLAEDTFTTFNMQLAGGGWCSSRTRSCGRRSRATSPGCGSSGCAGAAATSRSRCATGASGCGAAHGRLGGVSFALIWFSVFLMPALMLALVGFAGRAVRCCDRDSPLDVFRALWALSLVTYLFVTLSAFSLDGPAARASWREAVIFPGLISLAIIVCAARQPPSSGDLGAPDGVLLFAYVWLSASMLAAYAGEADGASARVGWLARPLLYVVGYGPLLCAITAAAYVEELRGAEMAWEKTEKTGTVGEPGMTDPFEDDERFERRLFWRQLAIVVLVALLIALLAVVR